MILSNYYKFFRDFVICLLKIIIILAIGPRAFLDFPDRIIMPESPVKIPSTKAFVIRNGGNSTAVYTVYSNR